MKKPAKNYTEAKLIAFRDITEELQTERAQMNISVWDEFAPVNYLIHEKDICESLGIPVPDFRVFNGGHNKKK